MKLYDEASKLITCETKQKEKITSVSQGSMEEGSLVVCIVLHRIFEVASAKLNLRLNRFFQPLDIYFVNF